MRSPARPSADDPVSNKSVIHAGYGVGISGASTELVGFAIGRNQRGVGIIAVREIEGGADVPPLPRQYQHVRGSRAEFLFGLSIAKDTMFALSNSPKSSAIQSIGGTPDAGLAA
jgi:hypothetical protein